MAKILAPNKEYTGISASVPFINGEGHTNDLRLIEWFKDHGYEVIEEEKQEDTQKDNEQTGNEKEADKSNGEKEEKSKKK